MKTREEIEKELGMRKFLLNDSTGRYAVLYDRAVIALSDSRLADIDAVMEMIEEKFGKYGEMRGSLGYQGMMMDIQAYQTPEDKQRDEILDLIDEAKKQLSTE
ncbi:MAG: hypothetical protein V4509_01530 [Patescibacteria group bacterium]